MLDGTNSNWSGNIWRALALPLAKAGFSPNQVTWMGLVLVAANCAAYYWHRESLWLGVGFAFSFLFDGLDGAVARITGKTSKYGGYLDAVIDRYQEVLAYLAIGLVTEWWLIVFLALSGSLLVSYNKASTAVEIPIDNGKWPDLMERLERIIVLCAGLVFDSFFALPEALGGRVLFLALSLIAGLSHITAVQRFLRARAMIMNTQPD